MRALAIAENNTKKVEVEKVSGEKFYKVLNQLWDNNPEFRESFNDDKTYMYKCLVKSTLRVRLINLFKDILKRLEV